MTRIKISIIIPTFNNENTIKTCIDSVLNLDYPRKKYEVIVVNDGSTDRTADVVGKFSVNLKNIRHKGRSAAINVGIKSSRGNLLFFTDADCIVPRNWIKAHMNCYKECEDISGVSGVQIPKEKTFIELFKVSKYIDEIENTYLLKNYNGLCLNGNNMSIKKPVIESIGGFDENFLRGADCDLTERILNKGHKLLRTHKSWVYHLKTESLFRFMETTFQRSSGVVAQQLKNGEFSLLKNLLSFFYIPMKGVAKHKRGFEKMRKNASVFNTIVFSILFLLSYYTGRIGNLFYYSKFRGRLG